MSSSFRGFTRRPFCAATSMPLSGSDYNAKVVAIPNNESCELSLPMDG